MGKYINIGIIQSSVEKMNFESCLDRIEEDVNDLMAGMNKPELVLGVEMAIGGFFNNSNPMSGDSIPGRVTDRLSGIAKKHKIYFIPGSMVETKEANGGIVKYNSAPIFGPDGEIIDVYRKMCPYLPIEKDYSKGDKYVTFKIKEKDISIGLMICHDWCFPEISRNLALMGAEVLVRLAADPEGLYSACKSIPQTRAFENQCYFLSLNMSGKWMGSYCYGRSTLACPDGSVMYEAGENPASLTLTLDIDKVRDAREFGTCYTEQLLRQLKYFNPPMDIYKDLEKAPIYETIPNPDMSVVERDKYVESKEIQNISKR